MKRTEEVRQEKAVSKSVNREARLNGALVGKETLDALDASRLDMTKAETFDHTGNLVNVSGYSLPCSTSNAPCAIFGC